MLTQVQRHRHHYRANPPCCAGMGRLRHGAHAAEVDISTVVVINIVVYPIVYPIPAAVTRPTMMHIATRQQPNAKAYYSYTKKLYISYVIACAMSPVSSKS